MSLASLREWTSEEQAWKFHTDDAPGLSESCDVDGRVVKVSGQSRDILFKKRHP